jgi:hypothetical protein
MTTEKKLEPSSGAALDDSPRTGSVTATGNVDEQLEILGYKPELRRNRSMFHLLFQTLAIAAIPYGEGGPLISAIYGGGPLSIFVGWIVVCILDECIALSLSELASRYPTSAGPYYWSFQIARGGKTVLSYLNGWTWLIGNWTITLSVNFGFASLIGGAVSMYHPDFVLSAWQLLLIFYAICLITFVICTFGNRFLPMVSFLSLPLISGTVDGYLVQEKKGKKNNYVLKSYALKKKGGGWVELEKTLLLTRNFRLTPFVQHGRLYPSSSFLLH